MECQVKHWAVELAEMRIAVNGVTAGLLKTDSLKVLRQYWKGVDQLPDSCFVALDEVADVVVFLCTDAARAIKGQMLVVDNGLSNALLRFSQASPPAE